MRYVITAVALLSAVAPAAAQSPEAAVLVKQAAEHQATVERSVQNVRINVEAKQTKGAPYSAEATTESTQVLADGNRIVTKSGTRVYRDSDGRTRREQLNAAGTDAIAINISDPVAGNTFVLDPSSHTAYRNGLVFATVGDSPGGMTFAHVGPGNVITETTPRIEGGAVVMTRELASKEAAEAAAAEGKQVAEIKTRVASTIAAGGGGGIVEFVPGPGGTVTSGIMRPRMAEGAGTTTREDLGQQTIEGVTATGTRITTEIAAGAIGNEQPIRIVSEQWFSPELQVLVLTRHSDPRSGEIVYRLTGIVRAEPARSLFDVPPDYSLHESAIRRQE